MNRASFKKTLHRFLPVAFFLPWLWVPSAPAVTVEGVLKHMSDTYARVETYQTEVEEQTHEAGGAVKRRLFLYSFQKPNRIRLDFRSPHPGMTLVYPDHKGRVVVRPSGWAGFMTWRLAPGSFFLKVSSGQRIDETDMGRLIENITGSVTVKKRGPLKLWVAEGQIRIRVISENHFREGVLTRYIFGIGRRSWLPVFLEEARVDGLLERTVRFRRLVVNPGFPEGFFE